MKPTLVGESNPYGGDDYYELTEAIYNPNSYFHFPTSDHELRWKVTMGLPGDIVYGALVTPVYG